MGPDEANAWKDTLLSEIFWALSEHPPLQSMLVFKGARVLAARLDGPKRASLDIDSNLLMDFVASKPDPEERRAILEREISIAVEKHFESESPVRFSLNAVRLTARPPKPHPRGWDAYDVRISVTDHTRPGVLGLPSLQLDIAAPEALAEDSIAPLKLGNNTVLAYTLTRIAGEKLRAFLSTLPAYRGKMRKPGEAIRAKDIYDLAQIARAHSFDDRAFWTRVGEEFRQACESRYIDCEGLSAFEEDLDTTRSAYEKDATIPKDISFDEAWGTLRQIVETIERNGIVPFYFPLDGESES